MDNRVRDATKQLVNHSSLVLFRDGVKRLLDNMAAEGIHTEIESISTNSLGNGDDLDLVIQCIRD
jgi:hypothetical protein